MPENTGNDEITINELSDMLQSGSVYDLHVQSLGTLGSTDGRRILLFNPTRAFTITAGEESIRGLLRIAPSGNDLTINFLINEGTVATMEFTTTGGNQQFQNRLFSSTIPLAVDDIFEVVINTADASDVAEDLSIVIKATLD